MSLLVNLQFNGCQNGYDLTLNHSLSGSSCWGVLHGDFQRGPRPRAHILHTQFHSDTVVDKGPDGLHHWNVLVYPVLLGQLLSSYIRAQSWSGTVLGCLSCVNVNSFWQIHTGTSARGTQCQMDSHFKCVFIISIYSLTYFMKLLITFWLMCSILFFS